MDTFLAIASRREVREYEPRALPPGVEERILDAGRLSGWAAASISACSSSRYSAVT